MKRFFTHADPVVPVHHPRVLVETAAAHGADKRCLLAHAGISAEMLTIPEARISYAQFGMLTADALRLTNNPALGLDFGQNLHLSHMGMLGLAMMSSESLGAALETGLRHYRALAPAWDLRLRVEAERGLLTAYEALPYAPFQVFATEALAVAILGMGRHLLGRSLPVRELRLSYSKPPYAERYSEFFDMPVRFDQVVTEAEFDPAVLREPIHCADPVTAKLAERYIVTHTSGLPPVDGLLAHVRRQLSAGEGAQPSLDEIARALRTSPRSLRRGLQQIGTSYQELLEEARRNRAEAWIRSTELTVEQIADKLGFASVRSFRRAFKRWTGLTPNAFRNGGAEHSGLFR